MAIWESLFFWIFAFGAVASSIAVVVMRNPLYSALALILDFFFFAGLYGLLSAHLMAILQVLVYAGAIMVLFLFIIMLLNLRDDELGQFEFRVHHLISGGAIGGLLFFLVAAITPLVNQEDVKAQREAYASVYDQKAKAYEASLSQANAEENEVKRLQKMKKLDAIHSDIVRMPSAIKGDPSHGRPLYSDLSEKGLERVWSERFEAHENGGTAMNAGKWDRFDQKRVKLPPRLSSRDLSKPRASFGTIEPMSLFIVNRFVVPFELTALLLLAAIVGAVIIAKRRL